MPKLTFFVNGDFVKEDEARISVLDLGFVRGFGVFDFLRTYNGKPFKLDEHLQRFKNSASFIGLELPWSKEKLKKLVLETLKKNNLPEANIKIVASGGVSPDQITPSEKPTLVILVYPPAVYPKSYYEQGIKVITVPFGRAFPKAKSINYIPAIIALTKAKKEKAVEALYLNEDNEVLEGTTSNFFVFKNKILVTPKDGILSGITREVVIELAGKEFKVELRPIKYDELKTIDEAFLTASNKEVMPIVAVDNQIISDGKVGRNTKRVMESFKNYGYK